MKFTVRQDGRVIAGLSMVDKGNANLMMLAPETPLVQLDIDEHTWATDKKGERYFIIREE